MIFVYIVLNLILYLKTILCISLINRCFLQKLISNPQQTFGGVLTYFAIFNPISTGGRCFPRKYCLPVDNFFSFGSIATKFGDFSYLGISKIFSFKNQK